MRRNVVLVACLLMAGSALFATPIVICGTGFASGCGAQISPTSGSADGNFTLVVNADNSESTTAYVVLNNQYPISTGQWTADTATGEWIGPAVGGNENTSDAVGDYNYQESFSLTGFNLATVTLSGFWNVDNTGCIYLNGTNTGDCINNGPSGTTLTAFSIVNGTGGATFNQGANTITFETVNVAGATPNPTGLFVELSGTGTLSGVPEPASLAFVGLGLTALGLMRRRIRS